MSSQGSRSSRVLLVATFIASGAVTSFTAHAYQPGWYFGAELLHSDLKDSDGTAHSEAVVNTGTTCPVPVPGFPSQGGPCLLGQIGAGAPGETIPARSDPLSYRFKEGFGGGFNLGYLFEGGFRPELSLQIAENDIEAITLAGATTRSREAKFRATRLMANAWYDLDFGHSVIPYLGLGLGFQRSEQKTSGDTLKDNSTAYQLGAGLAWWVNAKTALSLDYRYLSAEEPEFRDDGPPRQTLEAEYEANLVGLSLRHSFGDGGAKDSDGDGVPDRSDKCPKTPAGVQVYSNGCPMDIDGDGVPDYLDKCPGTPAGTVVDTNGCPLDSDGDGVADHLDKCPGTPRGVMVGSDGCPIDRDGDGIPDAYDKCPDTPRGAMVGPDGCPAPDLDGDGVADFMDKCPNTPKGVPVGPDGCPLDSDGDGIPDYLDECPRTPPGAKVLPNGCALVGDCRTPRPGEAVDANGCALDKNFILRGVKFEFDSERLTEPAKQILNEVAETLNAYPDIRVDLEGHTDSLGSDAYNLGLSERRSNTVKLYLTSKGVAADRMNPVGYGETRPIDSNETEEGRENNRRVELKVVE